MELSELRPLNAFGLKILMAVLMLLDHIYLAFPGFPLWFDQASRVVAPVFIFLMTEGLVYTRDRDAYVRRILYSGLFMLAGNLLLQLLFGDPIQNSILMSLAIAAALIVCLDRAVAERSPLYFLCVPALLYAAMFFEGALLCPLVAVVFYYLRRRRLLMFAAYILVSFALCALFFGGDVFFGSQWMMVFAIIPICLYNGKRGPSGPFAKYFFYVFYPLHIWAIYLISHL